MNKVKIFARNLTEASDIKPSKFVVSEPRYASSESAAMEHELRARNFACNIIDQHSRVQLELGVTPYKYMYMYHDHSKI